jgi:transcriptional regulator GlxA family with amidase domain
MKQLIFLVMVAIVTFSCDTKTNSLTGNTAEVLSDTLSKHIRPFNHDLPTIGLLIYNGVLTTEVTAAADVFSKPTESGIQLFNVITIAETVNAITSEEGLKIVPDYTFQNCPALKVLFVPSAYDMWAQVHNVNIVTFIKEKDTETEYIVSNCAGAQLIGAAGIAAGKKIVTWIGGGPQLQKDYPDLLVQDDSQVTYVEDGKFLSSNGNLASYISALNLVEKMTSPEHRTFVESYLYLNRLQDWK